MANCTRHPLNYPVRNSRFPERSCNQGFPSRKVENSNVMMLAKNARNDMSAGTCARPLIVRCGAFGDMVLITAMVRELSARFRSPVDILTSGPWSEPLLRGQPGVGEILTVRSRKTPYWLAADQRRAVRRLRERGAGPTWFCDAPDAARSMLRRAGLAERFIVDVKDHPLQRGEHATEQWRRLAGIMPAALRDAMPPLPGQADSKGVQQPPESGCFLEVRPEQRADLDRWLGARNLGAHPLILIQMGNKRTMRRGLRRLAVNHKYWPLDRWAALLQHLHRDCPRHHILLLGTGPEYRLNEELAALAGIDRVHNVADDLPIPRLIALLARADALITVDSGPAHVAAAVGCPQIVLFGKALPSLYRPWGASGGQVIVLTGEVNGAPDMLGIETARVIEAWAALRRGGAAAADR